MDSAERRTERKLIENYEVMLEEVLGINRLEVGEGEPLRDVDDAVGLYHRAAEALQDFNF